ncbi:hypothetical protein BDV38DRAFT_263492 [Aspergillus pseudotamarii]|uniref:Secreted protein n=1 Tax=Aspergillus pseudotamarii TaxID=132259 RepID=A0A5N6SAQ2_ASPPS|nr:uncharacterized protein BDV38DRAFT_263492 [Aspergillus pseudotamarii]KAE8131806.1 hypothetical protein BDV38DRAFT_263492 [Aspergillus pseudotamarii]
MSSTMAKFSSKPVIICLNLGLLCHETAASQLQVCGTYNEYRSQERITLNQNHSTTCYKIFSVSTPALGIRPIGF